MVIISRGAPWHNYIFLFLAYFFLWSTATFSFCHGFSIKAQPWAGRSTKTRCWSQTQNRLSVSASQQTDVVDSECNCQSIQDNEILQRINQLNEEDVRVARQDSSLVFENLEGASNNPLVNYEWVGADSGTTIDHPQAVAIRTLDPILARQETAWIQQAAESLWNNGQASTSRYTYQYATNSEAHVSDFLTDHTGYQATRAINQALQTKLYPLIRNVFPSILPSESPLFVYDALVIRYNASQSSDNLLSAAPIKAGQPLHRDLGLVSVNIMLNDATEFQGGGTFFENQLQSTDLSSSQPQYPIKPHAVGHCLVHESSQRHAGAATVTGVRDILVLFITAPTAPKLVTARLKQAREYCEEKYSNDNSMEGAKAAIKCRIRHQQLAIQTVPDDGEAHQYLGTAYMEYAALWVATKDTTTAKSYLQRAIECFQTAAMFTPCDARVYNNLGIALARLESITALESFDTTAATTNTNMMFQTSEQAYEHGQKLLVALDQAECDVADEMDALARNYGLRLANQDRFQDAMNVLEMTAAKYNSQDTATMTKASRDGTSAIADAYTLYKYCQGQVAMQQQAHEKS